ncbi:hypothetical protein Tco_0240782 [Tanacetum coccineum]
MRLRLRTKNRQCACMVVIRLNFSGSEIGLGLPSFFVVEDKFRRMRSRHRFSLRLSYFLLDGIGNCCFRNWVTKRKQTLGSRIWIRVWNFQTTGGRSSNLTSVLPLFSRRHRVLCQPRPYGLDCFRSLNAQRPGKHTLGNYRGVNVAIIGWTVLIGFITGFDDFSRRLKDGGFCGTDGIRA